MMRRLTGCMAFFLEQRRERGEYLFGAVALVDEVRPGFFGGESIIFAGAEQDKFESRVCLSQHEAGFQGGGMVQACVEQQNPGSASRHRKGKGQHILRETNIICTKAAAQDERECAADGWVRIGNQDGFHFYLGFSVRPGRRPHIHHRDGFLTVRADRDKTRHAAII